MKSNKPAYDKEWKKQLFKRIYFLIDGQQYFLGSKQTDYNLLDGLSCAIQIFILIMIFTIVYSDLTLN